LRTIYSVGFFLAVILFPVGALYQPAVLGAWASTPAAILFFVLAIFRIFRLRFRAEAKNVLGFLIWIIVVSLISVALYDFKSFYFAKGIATLVLIISWISPILIIPMISERVLSLSVSYAIIVTLFGYIILDLNLLPNDLIRNLLVSSEFHNIYDNRPKGLNSEPSHFSAVIGRLLFAWFLIKESGKKYSSNRLLLFLIIFGSIMLFTGSKGAFASVVIISLSTFFSIRSILIFILIAPVIFFISPNLISLFTVDIQNFMSISTRAGLGLASLMSLLDNPLGYGVYGFYPVMGDYGSKAIMALPAILTNLSEIENIVYELESVSFKSSILDFLVIGGLAFVRLIYVILRNVNKRDPRVLAGIFYLIASGFYVEGAQTIGFFLLLGVIINCFKITTSK